MKTKLIFVLAFVSSTFSFAGIEPSVAVIPGSSNSVYKVVYKSETTSKVKVTIFNSEKQVVFTESISNVKGFSRPYNFSSLPEGEYTIEINNGLDKKVETVKYQEQGDSMLVSTMSVRKLNSAESKYLITAESKGLNIMTVSVYDEQGTLLHSQSHIVDKSFGVVYNVAKGGNYTFVLTDANGTSQQFVF
ncbi:MAG: hypothetical protein QM734_16825 [Cyclobacteriaceae bacterium]